MQIRLTTPEDYPQLLSWWQWFRFPAPTIEMLPNQMKEGLIVSFDGKDICAGFIYRTPSVIYWVEYIVSNPEIKDRELRKKALPLLLNNLCGLSAKMGAKIVYSSLKHPSLINHYLECHFIKSDENCVEMIKILHH